MTRLPEIKLGDKAKINIDKVSLIFIVVSINPKNGLLKLQSEDKTVTINNATNKYFDKHRVKS